MNKKQLITLTVIFAILITGLLVKHLAEKTDQEIATEAYVALPFSFYPSQVQKIEIGRVPEDETVGLVKRKNQWEVRSLWDAKADQEKVDALLNATSGAKGELRSVDESLLGDYGIDDVSAYFIKISGMTDSPILELRIGNQMAGKKGFFVRKEGSSEVYLVEVPFDDLFGIYMSFDVAIPPSPFWADLKLFTLNPEKVKKISLRQLKKGNDELMAGVERSGKDDSWILLGDSAENEVDSQEAIKYIATLNSVRAKAVVDPNGEGYGLEEPVWQLEVLTSDDQKWILEAGPQGKEPETEEDIYFVKFAGQPHVFSLAKHFFEDLDIKNEKFMKEEVIKQS